MLNFILGICVGFTFFEPLVINFIYMTNPGLFNDIILTKKSSEKLRKFFQESRD